MYSTDLSGVTGDCADIKENSGGEADTGIDMEVPDKICIR